MDLNRRQFLLGSVATLLGAGLAGSGLSGCAPSGGDAAKSAAAGPAVKNDGTIDVKKACRGQDTPGLVSLKESIDYNQIVSDPSEKSTAPTITQDTVPYLHTSDYGRPVDLMVELLTPSNASAEKTPLVVWVNGGGFVNSDPAGSLDTRLAFAKAGYVVASVQYRTSCVSSFPAPLQDVKAAIRFLKANSKKYKFNPDMVAIGGGSAGGYYATMVGVTSNLKTIPWPNAKGETVDTALDVGDNLDQSSAVNCVMDYYGISDLTIIGSGLEPALADSHKSPATTEALLLNGAAAAQKGVGVFDDSMIPKVSVASPFSYIDKSTVPFIMFHGTKDTLVSPVSSKMLQKRLEDEGVYAERYVLDGAGHGTSDFLQPTIKDRALKFLEKYASTPVSASAPSVDTAKGTKAYAAADLPTMEQACQGAEKIETDSNVWHIDQVKDITYKVSGTTGTYTNLKMNMLIPKKTDKDSPRPVLYCAACGGLNKSNPNAMQYLRYAERGYIVAVSEVRVVPNVVLPAPIQDAKAGVRWLRAHAGEYNIDPNCIIATGSSAGGYMGVMVGVLGNTTKYSDDIKFDVGDNLDQSSEVQGVLDFFGISDLTIIGAGLSNYDVHDSPSNTEALIVNGTAFGTNPGGSIFSDLDKAAIFSPFTYLDKNDPPFLMFHGTEDMSVSPVSTMELYKRCKDLGITTERYSFVGAGHGGWQMSTDKANKIVDKFMDDIVEKNKKS